MIISESIRAWVRGHDLQDTLLLMGSGEVIVFIAEEMTTADSMTATVLTAAYMYFEVERERRSIQQHEMYKRRVAAGEYTPMDYFGYAPGTFEPDENGKYIVEMFLEASQGVEADEMPEWMNDCGLRTVRGNEFTPRAVRAILSNPVYCGDVVFHRAGRVVRDHHEALVSRELWETVNGGRGTELTQEHPILRVPPRGRGPNPPDSSILSYIQIDESPHFELVTLRRISRSIPGYKQGTPSTFLPGGDS